MPTERLRFDNPSGHALAAYLDTPADETPAAYALFAHCFTCSKNLHASRDISAALTDNGIAVLRFDFTGLGESEGDFADSSFSSNVDDLVAAAEFLASRYRGPQLLVGHSLGGAAVLQAAARIATVTAVATVGAPCDPAHVTKLFDDKTERIASEGEAQVKLAGRTFTIKQQFLDDLEETRMRGTIRELGRALLVCHAPLDNQVGIENAAHIFERAKHPKSFVSLDSADHLLSDEHDSRYAGNVIAAWAQRYLTTPDERAATPAADEGVVLVRTGRDRYRTQIAASGHHLLADEPVAAGGTGQGATPYDYLLGALGACTAITLRMYADRKQWPLEQITVRLRHEKLHAGDCAECETEEGRVDRIDRQLELRGELDDKQRQRLVEIADRCPVHRTLHSETVVRTRLGS